MSHQPAVRGYVVGPGEGVPDRTRDVKASGWSTGGSLTVMELAVDGGPPSHTHATKRVIAFVPRWPVPDHRGRFANCCRTGSACGAWCTGCPAARV